MNREIKTKKVGRQKKLTNPCPVIKGETEVMVGSPRCITANGLKENSRRMEKPTFTAIYYNSLENKVIEGLVRDNYSKIKNTFYKVFNKRSKNPNSPVGLCADLIEASHYNDDPDRIVWFPVSKEYNAECIKILECALEDLERIKREGEPKLPPLTEDEPIMY